MRLSMTTFMLGDDQVGPGSPPVFWPDIDVYFKGSTDVALGLIDHLQAIGCKWVKGAVIHRSDLCLDTEAPLAWYDPGHGMRSEPYRAVVERHAVGLTLLESIFGNARDRGLHVALSVYDKVGLDFAVDLGVSAIKIPSSNLVHAPLIRAAASVDLPLVIDTGRSTGAEIARAVGWARAAGAERLIVQHSPPKPPAPMGQHHLRRMIAIAEAFGCPVGLSDHHEGEEMLPLAVALGASLIEKAVYADGSTPDVDLAHAMPISRVESAIRACEVAWHAQGPSTLDAGEVTPHPARMGLIGRRPIHPGDRLTEDTVDFAWPAIGIPVEAWDVVSGWEFVSPVQPGAAIRWPDVRAVAE